MSSSSPFSISKIVIFLFLFGQQIRWTSDISLIWIKIFFVVTQTNKCWTTELQKHNGDACWQWNRQCFYPFKLFRHYVCRHYFANFVAIMLNCHFCHYVFAIEGYGLNKQAFRSSFLRSYSTKLFTIFCL